MGSRGPVADPNSQRSASGRNTLRAARRSDPGPVRMPTGLAKIKPAAAMWKRLAPALIESGRLTPESADAFALLCRLHAELELLDDALASEGFVVATERGPVANPIARLARAARNDWVSLARDFGLTAASSARLPEIEDEDESDPLAEFG
jgi:P27 family predicted phage terminase small subunit